MLHPPIKGQSGYGVVMYGRSMLVHCFCCLGAATSVFDAELQYCDGMLAMWARERSHGIDHFDGVMSHSSKSSPYSAVTPKPKLLRFESASDILRCHRTSSGTVDHCSV